ncbi:MAG: tRNA uracil 4-sulfurtransferase ThiI [Candidatus Peregrinibacteria bacterium]
MKRYIIVHYGEIGLKKSNTDYFVGKLKERIKSVLQKNFRKTFPIRYTLGRLLVDIPDDFDSEKDEKKYADILFKVFGIKNFKFVYAGSVDLDKLGKQVFENMPKEIFDPKTKPASFRVKAKRSMDLPFKSVEAERDIGATLIDKGIDIKVKMKDPELVVDVEFFNDKAYFSFKKYVGAGGLSPSTQGKLICLMSSGIDSPVASYMMMKRGAKVIFVHFHGYPYTGKDEMEQAKEIVGILRGYQPDTKLYLVPFGKIQKSIATNLDVPGKVRTLLYRRMMVRIAEDISRREHAKGIVTGDNFGQVASQTPQNLFAVHAVSSIPLFQPLIGFDKEEIIRISEKIGTFEISKLPCKESCTMFMPKSPELKGNAHDLEEFEKSLPVDEWIRQALAECEIVTS